MLEKNEADDQSTPIPRMDEEQTWDEVKPHENGYLRTRQRQRQITAIPKIRNRQQHRP